MNDNEVVAVIIKAAATVLAILFVSIAVSEAVDSICSAWKENKTVRIILISETKGE